MAHQRFSNLHLIKYSKAAKKYMYWIYTKIEKYDPQLRSPELNRREKVRFRNKKQILNELPVYQA